MKYAILTVSVLIAGQAVAGSVDVGVENFTHSNGVAKAVLKVSNSLGKPASNIFVDCAFLNGEKKAIDVGSALIEKIANNEYAYDTASIVTKSDVQYVDCRVSKFD
ncbi:hypothetical protein IB276_26250 [Ensifer sp. ENS04]|uniref:hypothetical protein n=1 Tax=Ensifer sp. ENS04 TaxID=2769281 RepID=UPI0017835DDE|nr:hypothetical protein [Ensifer sp. ENS04]MBD9542952.1 hypothetical protein [Ensifer sp. ENS04]